MAVVVLGEGCSSITLVVVVKVVTVCITKMPSTNVVVGG